MIDASRLQIDEIPRYESLLTSSLLIPFDTKSLVPFFLCVASTHDKYVFSFYPDYRSCHGFEEALARYREIVPFLNLSGFLTFSLFISLIFFMTS